MTEAVAAHVRSPAWRWSQEGPVAIGSAAHKALFCRMLLDTHDRYRPSAIEWPSLDGEALTRLTSLPFWDIAVETEDRAGAHIAQAAEQEADPLIREALDLMAFEERRHRHVLDLMVGHYGIPLKDHPPYTPPPDALWNFLTTGYGECLDSFFAFGLFELAKRSGFFPLNLVEVFEPVIQEEARHLLFFVNWVVYTQACKPAPRRLRFFGRRLAAVIDNGRGRFGLMRDETNVEFAGHGREAIGVDISPRGFIDLCLEENERRLACYDPRLVRPGIMPRLARLARPLAPRH